MRELLDAALGVLAFICVAGLVIAGPFLLLIAGVLLPLLMPLLLVLLIAAGLLGAVIGCVCQLLDRR